MANQETKTCQNCKASFEIVQEDFDFYKKIDVPAPTWCPECRLIRKMVWGSSATALYPRTCQAPGHSEKILSVYPETAKMPVYDYKYWNSDAWDPLSYGKEYDFSRSFFEQFKELLDAMPAKNVRIVNSENCDYCIAAVDSKNCYLCSGIFGSENCLYCHTAPFSKECVDNHLGLFDEQVYGSFNTDKSFLATFSVFSQELVNCDFMYDCRACTDCLGCVGLRSKQYCIFNKQYSKEDYKKERAKYDLGSYAIRQQVAARHDQMVLTYPRKYAYLLNAPGCTGDHLMNARNCQFVFQGLDDIENCKYVLIAGRGMKDSYDVAGAGLKSNLLYEVASSVGVQRVYFSYSVDHSHDVYYSRDCRDSEYLFGCVGLKSKKYCIFNKQYLKEEYHALVAKIIEQMKQVSYTSPRGQRYSFGEFFPLEHSPFPYSASWAAEYFTISKNEALAKGYAWRDGAANKYAITLQSGSLPDHIKDVPDSILNEVIECSHKEQCSHDCTGAFKIIPAELQFYKKLNIVLPRECSTCRYRIALRYLTPYKLWKRECMCGQNKTSYRNTGKHSHGEALCKDQFETAYAPGRPELLYCEACYNAEIL